MEKRGNKVLLGFLAFGVLTFLLAMVLKENHSVELSNEKPQIENHSAEVNKDISITEPEPTIDDSVVDKQTATQRNISLESYDLEVEDTPQWKLPGRLEEISGLAMTADNRLLAHNDEKAVIHEIDYINGVIVNEFQLADIKDPVTDDFEGIATAEDKVYLVTSSGRLYECREGTAEESVLFNVYTTGVGRDYEIEGLTYDESHRALLLMCKDARNEDLKDQLVIYFWSIDKKHLMEDAHIVIPVIEFSRHIDEKNFQPSGIERHPVSGNYFVVAARQKAIAEITPTGQVVAAKQFPHGHRQAEGITFTANSTLIVADEGAGKKARLTLYPLPETAP